MHILSHHLLSIACAGLPIAAYGAAFRLFRRRGEPWREAAMAAATCWGVFLALITEILSLPRLLTRPVLAFIWLLPTVVIFAYGSRLGKRRSPREEFAPEIDLRGVHRSLEVLDWFLLAWIGVVVALVGITALIAPPNTWDAMAYHMSRVVQWMTNRDVRPYPAFYSPQLFLSPWAEYAILHFDLLYGSDRLANLVNWFSMAGAITGVSLIAKRLGAGARGQVLAAAACATLPAGILEASGAMNTYAGAFWVVVAVDYALRWNQKPSWKLLLGIGAASSLAILTKGTNYLFLPFVLLACWWLGPSRARWLLLKRLPVIILAILALNGPLYARNYLLSGSPLGFSAPLGDDPERQYGNSHLSLSVALANTVKNLALHTGTPVDALNRLTMRTIDSGFRFLGVDPNDKASTYRGGFHLNPASSYESTAGNPLQLALICVVTFLLLSPRWGNRRLRIFMLGIGCSFILFCAAIRWQAWNGRYHLPLFALAAAVLGVVLERIRPRSISAVIAILLLVSAMPFTLLNSLRPLAPWKRTSILRASRAGMYFADYHETLEASYLAAARTALKTGCRNIGIDAALEDFDYPIFAFLDAGHGPAQVRYTGVPNSTSSYARPETGVPCLVVCLRCANAPAKWAQYRDIGGRVTLFDEIALFSPHGDLRNDRTFTPPPAAAIPALLQTIDRDRDTLRTSHLGSLEAKVARAEMDWPDMQVELSGQIDSLYGETYAGWRIRDSAYPLLRSGERLTPARFDPLQVAAAAQVLHNWNETMPQRIQALNGLIDQMYTFWRIEVADSQSPETGDGGLCRVQLIVHRENPKPPAAARAESVSEDRSSTPADCRCLAETAPGGLLAWKGIGRLDSEARNLTACSIVHDSAGVWTLTPPGTPDFGANRADLPDKTSHP